VLKRTNTLYIEELNYCKWLSGDIKIINMEQFVINYLGVIIFSILFLSVLRLYIFYCIIKNAVKNGITEAAFEIKNAVRDGINESNLKE
jgi:hypothetical protein